MYVVGITLVTVFVTIGIHGAPFDGKIFTREADCKFLVIKSKAIIVISFIIPIIIVQELDKVKFKV